MQPVEITLRYIVAAIAFAIAIVAFRLAGVAGAVPATLAGILALPALDSLIERLRAGELQRVSDPGAQSVLRTAFAMVLTTLRAVLCVVGLLYSLHLIQRGAERTSLRLEHAPSLSYRPQVTLDGSLSGAAGATRAGRPPRLRCNGQPVALESGHFVSRQPLQMGLNTFRMALDVIDGATGSARTIEQTVVVRRVSEEEYDRETFGRGDCALSGSSVHRSGAWGPGWPASRFSGTTELRAAELRGRCVQELTASRLPLSQQAAAVELKVAVGRGRIKVLLRHPDGSFERRVVTPGQPLVYSGSAELSPLAAATAHPVPANDETLAPPSPEEFWVAYVSLESLAASDDIDATASEAELSAQDVSLDAHYVLK